MLADQAIVAAGEASDPDAAATANQMVDIMLGILPTGSIIRNYGRTFRPIWRPIH